jgi:molecular chaperone GrpE
MSYLYDPRYNRRRGNPSAPSRPPTPTVADYQALSQAYEALKTAGEQQGKDLQNARIELATTKEALHQQSEDLKSLEAELLFARAGLEDAQGRLAEAEDQAWPEKYARLQAEVDNLRKRWEQRFANESAEFRRKLLSDMIPVADHLDLALQHAPPGDDAAVKNFIGNIEATRRAFLDALRRYGVERIDPLGESFDPNRHEAIGHAPGGELPAEHVAQVVQAGYMEGDRLVRPARVLVSA